ncbi:MAG: type I-G CRISPR-associated RAMP protein Csb1/Cas7g [Acidimicrobiia bacterium]
MNPNRIRFRVPLVPATGSMFQPTGFPDVGAATFSRPTGEDGKTTECLLVESAQSMANHLEAVGWDAAAQAPVSVLDGLPWVRVVSADDGRFLTSSRLESHRLASAFVKDSMLDGASMKTVLRERLALREDTPLDHRAIAKGVFALDPLCLVHGVFFAEAATVWPGQPKIARAITALVEATDVGVVNSGGVKRDMVLHSAGEGTRAESGYGSIPFHRQEFTALSITLHVSIDRLQFRSYGLGDVAADLLEAIALWEVRTLLDQGLRLRTACDLDPIGLPAELPAADELAARVRAGIGQCSDGLAPGGALEVKWARPKGAKS